MSQLRLGIERGIKMEAQAPLAEDKTDVAAGLTMFSFADLAVEIGALRARAQEKDSWSRLLEATQGLGTQPAPEGVLDAVTGRRWALATFSARGFRGITNEDPLEVVIDPTPGVTVLHGANGSGKSSLSDALEAVLTGTVRRPRSGARATAQLWDPIPVGRGHDNAIVEATLTSNGDYLHLRLTVPTEDAEAIWVCEFEAEGVRRVVNLGQAWRDAWRSHRPVFAYATVERRVQLSKDLAEYFDDLLALGGSFIALQDHIEDRSGDAETALASWTEHLAAAKSAIVSVDAKYQGCDIPGFNPGITDPAPDSNVDDWASRHSLSTPGGVQTEISTPALNGLITSAEEALLNLRNLGNSQHAFPHELLPGLRHLSDAAATLSDHDYLCPVCAQPAKDWPNILNNALKKAANLTELRTIANKAVRNFAATADSVLPQALEVTSTTAGPQDLHHVSQGLKLLETLSASTSAHGTGGHVAVDDAVKALAAWVQDGSTDALLRRAIDQTNNLSRWRTERSNAAADFLSCWRSLGPAAAAASEWRATAQRLNSLRKALRTRRTTILQERASNSVQALLEDVGLTLTSVNVSSSTARMVLADSAGNEVTLGMLSAGQRNAVLLAPLLACLDSGPFAFVVLDDPVHAFDQIRVDILAKALATVAKDRRVVVLTHDERLREQLLALPVATQSFEVARSADDGTVEVLDSTHFWSRLLDDAESVLDLGSAARTTIGVTDIVRGLCRQAVDNALREFTVQNAMTSGRNVHDDLSTLDSAMQTKGRFLAARNFFESEPNPVIAARAACDEHLLDWNRASHGNVPTSEATREEIAAARLACATLTSEVNT